MSGWGNWSKKRSSFVQNEKKLRDSLRMSSVHAIFEWNQRKRELFLSTCACGFEISNYGNRFFCRWICKWICSWIWSSICGCIHCFSKAGVNERDIYYNTHFFPVNSSQYLDDIKTHTKKITKRMKSCTLCNHVIFDFFSFECLISWVRVSTGQQNNKTGLSWSLPL